MLKFIQKFAGTLIGKCFLSSVFIDVCFRLKGDDNHYELPLIALVIIFFVADAFHQHFDEYRNHDSNDAQN